MEYPFKDLQPLDEATARTGYYKDWTHIDADTFHQISELVKFIREKGYGADTREAIAQALERVYHDTAMSGNANMEVSIARGGFDTLGERLNDTNTQLAQKVNKNRGEITSADLSQEVKEAMTGGSVAVVGIRGVGTENLKEKAVTAGKTSYLEPSPNSSLIEPNQWLANTDLNTSGVPYTIAGRKLYLHNIPVKANIAYRVFGHLVVRVALFNHQDQFQSHIGVNLNNATFTPNIDGYVKIVGVMDTTNQLTLIEDSKFNGEAMPFRIMMDWLELQSNNIRPHFFGGEHIKVNSLTVDNMSFIEQGTNFFNKNNIQEGKFLSGLSSVSNLDNYYTSHPVYSVTETAWVINNCRAYAIYNMDGSGIRYENTTSNTATVNITTPANSYLLISGALDNLPATQINKGAELLPYEEYRVIIPGLQLNELVEQESSDIELTVNGNDLFLKSHMGNSSDIEINALKYGRGNQLFNFVDTKINGERVHNTSDDVTPIRTFDTVGANHGYTVGIYVTMSGHGKQTRDLGSQWTDGTTEYTLVAINGNVLTLLPMYTTAGGVSTAVYKAPVANLTHVQGATSATAIDITTHSTGQLYPSVNNRDIRILLDGEEITEDGTYYGNKLQVFEKYQIMDYKAIIDWSQSHIGQSYDNNDVAGVAEIGNSYTFTKGLDCTTSHTLRALKRFDTKRSGFLQSAPLDGNVKRTMTGIDVAGFNFAIGVDLSTYNSNLLIEDSQLKQVGIPPSHYTDWQMDDTGKRKYGFSLGYIVDKTNSKNTDRVANTDVYWDLRSTKKSYPVAINEMSLNVGDYLSFAGFRQYLLPKNEVSNHVVVRDNRDTYVYADFNQSSSYSNVVLDSALGKEIEVIQSNAYTQLNDVVDLSGVVGSSGGAGGAVIKVV